MDIKQNLRNLIKTYDAMLADPATNDRDFRQAREHGYCCKVLLEAIERLPKKP
jgi:hypothetical protein